MTTPATAVNPGPVSVNVAPVIVAALIGSLNVAVTSVLIGTAAAPAAGNSEITVGPLVVNVQTKFAARAPPLSDCAPVVTVAVYNVLAASGLVGVYVATVLARVTAPGTTTAPGPFNVNVVVVIEAGAIGVLNVAVTTALSPTTVAPLTGNVDVTVGITGAIIPHPDARATNMIVIHTNVPSLINVRISLSCLTGDKMSLRFHVAVRSAVCPQGMTWPVVRPEKLLTLSPATVWSRGVLSNSMSGAN